MLNHARTLLLNVAGGNQSPGADFPGEELIPAEFRPVRLNSDLLAVRGSLFGANPDRLMLNYRAKQLMTILHATELVEFVQELDSRLTYEDAVETRLFEAATFTPQVTHYSGSAQDQLYLLGQPVTPDVTGRTYHQYNVDVLSPTTVATQRQTPPFSQQIADLTLTDGLSNRIDLPGCGYQFRINTDSPGSAWHIEVWLRPQWTLGQLTVLLDKLGEPVLLGVLGLSRAEPWNTFRSLWNEHPELPYRLGGLLLAYIYRTEEIRRGQR